MRCVQTVVSPSPKSRRFLEIGPDGADGHRKPYPDSRPLVVRTRRTALGVVTPSPCDFPRHGGTDSNGAGARPGGSRRQRASPAHRRQVSAARAIAASAAGSRDESRRRIGIALKRTSGLGSLSNAYDLRSHVSDTQLLRPTPLARETMQRDVSHWGPPSRRALHPTNTAADESAA